MGESISRSDRRDLSSFFSVNCERIRNKNKTKEKKNKFWKILKIWNRNT